MGMGAVKECHGVLLTTDDVVQLWFAARTAFIVNCSNCTRHGFRQAAKTAGKEEPLAGLEAHVAQRDPVA